MAVPEPLELGHNSVVVAIDKGKNSQVAVQWTVDHFLKGSNVFTVVLVHVKTHNFQYKMNKIPMGSIPSEADVKQLFLPYRGYCGRKGISAYEVVLHDIDVSSALIRYITENNIGNIVVGASNHNVLTRRFKPQDVPTSLEKAAPQFCNLYVIYKGKVQSMRASNVCNVPSSLTSSKNRSNNSKSSYSSGADSQSTTSGHSSSRSQGSSTSQGRTSPFNNRRNDSTSSQTTTSSRSSTKSQSAGGPVSPSKNTRNVNASSRPTPSSRSPSKSPEMGHPRGPCHDTLNANASRIQDLRQPTHPSIGGNNNDDDDTSSKTQGAGPPPTHPHNYGFDCTSSPRNHIRQGSGGMPIKFEANELHSRKLTRTQSIVLDEEDDEEMRQLKLEIKKKMELFKTICKQVSVAKQKAELLQSIGEDSIEDVKLAREAVNIVVELERERCKAAMDTAQMTERLVKMETRKRIIAEEKAAKRQEDGQRARNVSHRVYTFEEIKAATNNFSEILKIGEGGYGPVFRGILQHTPVAIKVLRPDASQGLKQFQQEIEVLGRIRHPNMVLLLGACAQYGCLVYEFMENGSLEDRLFCRNNTPPIPWRTRFKIAAEIGSALLFLHETKPEPMVHRDLKPANILLDGNYTSKIADVGLARLVPPAVANQITQYHMTAAAGTFFYIDPEYQQTGKLGTKSDVYSFGIMLLQLITGRPPMALSYHVEEAIDEGTFGEMLDPSITDWPVEEALSLAKLALNCSQLRKKDRPSLDSVVLPELIRLRDFALKIS